MVCWKNVTKLNTPVFYLSLHRKPIALKIKVWLTLSLRDFIVCKVFFLIFPEGSESINNFILSFPLLRNQRQVNNNLTNLHETKERKKERRDHLATGKKEAIGSYLGSYRLRKDHRSWRRVLEPNSRNKSNLAKRKNYNFLAYNRFGNS